MVARENLEKVVYFKNSPEKSRKIERTTFKLYIYIYNKFSIKVTEILNLLANRVFKFVIVHSIIILWTINKFKILVSLLLPRFITLQIET